MIRIVKFLFLLLLSVNVGGIVSADLVVTKEGKKFEGIILSQDDFKVELQKQDGWHTFLKEEIESVQEWDKFRNAKLKSSWKSQSFVKKVKQAFSRGPRGVYRLIYPYHQNFMNAVVKTKLYQLAYQWQFVKDYKAKNPTGFNISIYCIVILLLAFVLKVIKEIFLLILSIFGVNSDK